MLAFAIIVLAALVILAGLLWFADRARRQAAADRDQAIAAAVEAAVGQVSATNDAQVAFTVERVVSAAGDTLATHLAGGQRELELRTQSFDAQVSGVVESLEKKLGTVNEIVHEQVVGVQNTVGESVSGMSKVMTQQQRSLQTEMIELRKLVATLQTERAEQHGLLVERLESTAREQHKLAETTGQLRHALASPKARGQWGERMADDVLRTAGFVEGINYLKEQTLPGGTTPDFTFLLPQDQLLHMDVKFPVDNYLRFLEAESDFDREQASKKFLKDVRNRINELVSRGYVDSDTTVGYLLLFIPNESVYGFIHEHDGEILDYALAQQVVLCSPTSLFATLGVVRQAIDSFKVAQTSGEILRLLGSFGDEWSKFGDAIAKVDKNLTTLNNSFGELSGPRRRQLQKQLDKIDEVRHGEGHNVLAEPVVSPVLRDVSQDLTLDLSSDVSAEAS